MQALLTDIFSWIGGLWEWIAQRYSSSPGAGSRRAAAFIRFNAADGAGHVGWAFDFSDSDVNAGAVENPNGTPSCPRGGDGLVERLLHVRTYSLD
jgi:hypothetical protein